MSFDAFNEVAKEADERTKEIELMKAKLEFLEKEKEEATNQSKQEMERKMAAIVANLEQVKDLFHARAMKKQ